jgi:hypothetical protein
MGFLTDLKIRTAAPRDKEYLIADGDGLYLRVRKTRKSWLYRYKVGTKEFKIGFGAYPIVTLAMARNLTRDASTLRAQGIDPLEARREQQEQTKLAKINTFELTARAWLKSANKDREWSVGYKDKVTRHLEIHVFPWVGDKAMDSIKPTEIVRCLHRVKDRGNLETAQRVREAVQHVYQYAVDTGVLEPVQNFVNKNTGGLPTPRSRHYAAITDPKLLGQLLRDIRAYNGNFITVAALRLAPLVFHRARLEGDGPRAPRLGQREKRVRHQILRIARAHVAGQCAKEHKLLAFARCRAAPRHVRPDADVAAPRQRCAWRSR